MTITAEQALTEFSYIDPDAMWLKELVQASCGHDVDLKDVPLRMVEVRSRGVTVPNYDRFLVNIVFGTVWGADGEMVTPVPRVEIDLSSTRPIDKGEMAEDPEFALAAVAAHDVLPGN